MMHTFCVDLDFVNCFIYLLTCQLLTCIVQGLLLKNLRQNANCCFLLCQIINEFCVRHIVECVQGGLVRGSHGDCDACVICVEYCSVLLRVRFLVTQLLDCVVVGYDVAADDAALMLTGVDGRLSAERLTHGLLTIVFYDG